MSSLTLPADERINRPLWFNISFLLMWSSVAASGFGDRVITLSAQALLGSHLDERSGTAITAGLTFFFFMPYVLLGAPAGWLADRLPRKWIMLFCDETRALLLLAAALMIPTVGEAVVPESVHWKIYGIMFAVGCLAATFNPARNATIPQIVPLRQLQAATALIIGIAVIASLIGLYVGGKLIDVQNIGSVRGCLIIGVLFYAISGTFFAFLKIRQRDRSENLQPQRQRSILPYIIRHAVVWKLIAVNTLVWACAMVVYAAVMGLCKKQYGIAEDEVFAKYTVMAGALGGGMLVGAIWMAWINTRRESGALGMACLLLAGLCTVGLAASRSYHMGMAFVFGVGFFGNGTIICFTALLQSISPNYIRGRVMGFNTLATTVFNVIVNYMIWQMDDADTRIIPVLWYMAILLAAIALWGLYRELTGGPFAGRLTNVVIRLSRLFVMVWHRTRWICKHNVPSEGAVILASNHTTALDPVVIQTGCRRIVRWVMLTRFRFKLFEPIWKRNQPIFLDKDEKDTGNIRKIINVLRDEEALLGLFPEGGLQRDHRKLNEFQPGIGMIARRSGATIVPVWISGTPQSARMLGHFFKPSRTTVVFGEPYKPDKGMSNQEVVDDLRRRLLELAARTLLAGNPEHALCPQCGHDLHPALTEKQVECPGCGFDFSFVRAHDDPEATCESQAD